MYVPPTVVDEKSGIGHDYLAGMHLAGRYAYAGREAVARHVVKNILGAQIVEEVHNHHNFAWREKHDGEEFWVVRKGATPAFPGQQGFVGGSMGDDAVIIEGVASRSEEHTSELQSPCNLVCRLLLEKKKKYATTTVGR